MSIASARILTQLARATCLTSHVPITGRRIAATKAVVFKSSWWQRSYSTESGNANSSTGLPNDTELSRYVEAAEHHLDRMTWAETKFEIAEQAQKVLDAYTKVAELSSEPVDKTALWGKGQAYATLGKLELARKNFEEAVALDPKYVPALLGLANILSRLQVWKLAINYYTKVFELFPTYYGQFGKDLATAKIDSEEYLSDIIYRRAICYYRLNDYSMCIDDMRALTKLNTKYTALAYHMIGNIFQLNEKWQESLEMFDEAIKHNPKLIDAYDNRSASYQLLGRMEDCLRDRKTAEMLRRERIWNK